MALPSLPDRKPMFNDAGYPTTPTRVWWQAVKRVFDALGAPSQTRTLTATGTAGASDYLLLVNATAGAVTVNLPAAASSNGVYLIVKKTDASGNAVTVDANGAETIDGAATRVLATQYATVTVFCDGTGWWAI